MFNQLDSQTAQHQNCHYEKNMFKNFQKLYTIVLAHNNFCVNDWGHITIPMVKAVKDAVKIKKTKDNGFDESKVGSHSLRAGGAMALYITKHSAMEIQRAGRWTSTTFMEYIHGQLDVVSKGLTQAMSQSVPFINMAR